MIMLNLDANPSHGIIASAIVLQLKVAIPMKYASLNCEQGTDYFKICHFAGIVKLIL